MNNNNVLAINQDANQQRHNRHTAGVTELILADDSLQQLGLILPMIAFLSHQQSQRWITWITPHPISRQRLESYGVNTRILRFIQADDGEQARWVTWEAMAAGTSHAVIASPGKLGDKELSQLEQAAYRGDCQGLLLRLR